MSGACYATQADGTSWLGLPAGQPGLAEYYSDVDGVCTKAARCVCLVAYSLPLKRLPSPRRPPSYYSRLYVISSRVAPGLFGFTGLLHVN
jgi:hypothetical protein